jgi:hypothetical protein
MQFLILGLALLVLVLIAGRTFARADAKALAKHVRRFAGWGVLGLALLAAVTGRIILAVPLTILGFSLLGWSFPFLDSPNSTKSRGQRSSVRTEMLEMTLDHDTGAMEGVVRKGRFEGRQLSRLSTGELQELLEEARGQDQQAAQLVEAYLMRFRQGGGKRGSRRTGNGASGGGAMTLEEAYAVLGLKPGASRDDIQQAHRALMKKYHPDQGGTTYLASKINEAKEILLRHAH